MLVIRETMYCKPGKVGEMVKRFKGLSAVMKKMGYKPFRVMTDVSGERFWTCVAEVETESLDKMREMEQKVMANEEASKLMAGYHELIEHGKRDIFKLED